MAQFGALPWREQIDSGMMPPPKREHIAMWTIAALQSISTQTVKNAWHHTEFGWFLEDAEENKVCLHPILK